MQDWEQMQKDRQEKDGKTHGLHTQQTNQLMKHRHTKTGSKTKCDT